ncbi:MAG: MTH895/ArsE family thioredoxin-like protein [Spirochaeta sp.]|jgi:small redox-active disulfide protein 2|nr:MTH895/ArsE family thioredoxin-like protein [Spirochaeta sp.]
MTIQILGTGCPKCKLLKKNSLAAVEQLDGDVRIEEVTDMDTMMEMGMLVSPGFAIDGELLKMGKVLTTEQVINLAKSRMTEA